MAEVHPAEVAGGLRGTPSAPAGGSLRVSERTICIVTGIVFALAAGTTYYFARTMSGGMRMPGNWTMSMMWMRMPGQTRLTAALVFSGMWLAMMVAMMLPSSLPVLLVYRRATAFRGDTEIGLVTWLVGIGYFAVWVAFGLLAYGAGMAIARAAMQSTAVSRVIPVASGVALMVAGLYQLTPWKSACLKHCRDPLHIVARHLDGGWRGALGLGLYHGAYCAACCWGLMVIQLALGVMNLAVMVAVAAVIAMEKLLARGYWIARVTGWGALGGGLALVARSVL